MYYKLYRRRKFFFITVGVLVLVVIYLYFPSESEKNFKNDDQPREPRMKSQTINMQNYIIPEPCEKCPGEYGSPVYLKVINLIQFMIEKFY